MNQEDLRQRFLSNPSINPVTGRKIMIGGSVYKKLVKEYGTPTSSPMPSPTPLPTLIPTYGSVKTQPSPLIAPLTPITQPSPPITQSTTIPSNIPSLTELPINVLLNILLNMDYLTLLNVCKVNKSAQSTCNSDAFWRQKYIHDFGQVENPPNIPWRLYYLYNILPRIKTQIPLLLENLAKQGKRNRYYLVDLEEFDIDKDLIIEAKNQYSMFYKLYKYLLDKTNTDIIDFYLNQLYDTVFYDFRKTGNIRLNTIYDLIDKLIDLVGESLSIEEVNKI